MAGQYRLLLPSNSNNPPPHKSGRTSRRRWFQMSRVNRQAIAALTVIALVIISIPFIFSDIYRQQTVLTHVVDDDPATVLAAELATATAGRGQFFRDPTPIRTARKFWELAEAQVAQLGADTCGDFLGRSFIEAYVRSKLDYCVSEQGSSLEHLPAVGKSHLPWVPSDPGGDDLGDAAIMCIPVHHDEFSKWWRYPASPCLSTRLRPKATNRTVFYAPGCKKTEQGMALDDEMGDEVFLGKGVIDGDGPLCKHKVDHTLLFIGRQDQWNPYHVAEDLVTTLVTLFIASTAEPGLIDDRLQLVFTDDFSLAGNHFTSLWSRMGAWSPRSLSIDPWEDGVCLTNAIHSVGAGQSILQADVGISISSKCASTITWAASHYYRYLFGLLPQPRSPPPGYHRPINVLWLSRRQFDAYARAHDDMSLWRLWRVLENEDDVLNRLRQGMNDMCSSSNSAFGPQGCVFDDVENDPELWDQTLVPEDQPVPLRFATIDPTTLSLEAQVQFAASATIIVSQHAGALGLTLFQSPGQSALLELKVPRVSWQFHFEHMAYQMGNKYRSLPILPEVYVDDVWRSVEQLVVDMAQV